MPNIFDGFRKMSDDDIIEQIALIETMNIANISKPIIQKAKKKTISLINFLGSKVGKNRIIEEPEVKEIWALVDEKKAELKKSSRDQLDERLLNIIIEKSKNNIEDLTEDEISIEVIEEAAKLYKLDIYLTPCQKADNIYMKYSERLNEKSKDYENKHNLIDLQEITKHIKEIFYNMNDEEKKDFEQSVDDKKPVLTNMLRKVNRQHFARLVWLSVKAYAGKFTPMEEILPSFMKDEKEDRIIKLQENLEKSKEELLEAKDKMESCKEKINPIEKKLKDQNALLNDVVMDRKESNDDIISLKKFNSNLEKLKKSQENKLKEIKDAMVYAGLEKLDLLMEEFKEVKFNIADINNKLSDIDIEISYKNELIKKYTKLISNKERNIKEISIEFQQVKTDAQNLIEDYNKKKEEVDNKEKQKRTDIFERWSKFFNKFIFEFDNLSNIVNFSIKELLHIEECLYELHLTKDPMAMSMGVIEDKRNKEEKDECQYIDVAFPDDFEIEIQYKVLDNEEKTVNILEITKNF